MRPDEPDWFPAAALLVVCALLWWLLPPPAESASYCSGGTRDRRSSTWLVGDSVSVLGRDDLPASIQVNARSRRTVDCLPSLIRARKARGTPRTAVVALGTNFSRGWSLADYRRAVESFPESTSVVLVTPWRDPGKHPYASRYTRRYSAWMRRLAGRTNVCVADWAAWADRHRSLLPDGTHPGARGQAAWGRIVAAAARSRCWERVR